MGDAVSWLFDGISLYTGLMMALGGVIMTLLGLLLTGYWIHWRMRSVRVHGRITGVYSSGARYTEDQWRAMAMDQEKSEIASVKQTSTGFWKGLFSDFKESPFKTFCACLILFPVCAVPFLFFGFGVWTGYQYLDTRADGIRTTGEIAEVNSVYGSDHGLTYDLVIRYTDNNNVVHNEKDRVSSGYKGDDKRGRKVTVYYDPEKPERFVMDRFWRYMIVPIVFVALGGGIIGFVGFHTWLRMTGRELAWHERRILKKREKRVGKVKTKYFSEQTYTPVFEFQLPGGQKIEAAGSENADNWLANKTPGTNVRLMVIKKGSGYKVKRPGIILLVVGIVCLVPGLLLSWMSVKMIKFSMAGVLIVGALFVPALIKGAKKFKVTIRPRSEWEETRKAMKERAEGVFDLKMPNGIKLEQGEIRERLRYMAANTILAAAVLALFGAGLLAASYQTYNELDFLTRNGIHAAGEIVDMKSRSGSDGSVYYPVVEFKDDAGETVRFYGKSGSNPPMFHTGDKVRVLYDPQKPQRAAIDHGWLDWLLPGGLGVGGLLMLLWAIQMFSVTRRHQRRI